MTNGEQTIANLKKLKSFLNGSYGTDIDRAIKALEQEPTIDYRRAFKIACELLNGSVLYGIDSDNIFEIMMQKDGLVSNDSYERYILNHLQELDRGQYESEET